MPPVSLTGWILGSPTTRTVWSIERRAGLWRVGLSVSGDGDCFERLPQAQAPDYAEAVANAIEIARLAGYG